MKNYQEVKHILKNTVKTGIVVSNLIPMFAGLTLAMFTYGYGLTEKIPEMILAVIGTALIIASAGAFNNLYDRDIDAIMERTKVRPTVTGEIGFKTTLWLGIIMMIIGVGALAFTTWLAAFLGFLGLFLYVVPYTMWSKRRTIYNTEIGSLSGAVPPLIGWAAIEPNIVHPALLGLFVIAILWQMPHFYAIAIRRHDDYKAANVPMLPVVKGIRRTYLQTNFYLIIMILASFLLGTLSIGLMLVGLLLGGLWLILSITSYQPEDSNKWAKSLFLFSLLYMSIMFMTIIIYSLMGIIFKL
ncbi:heme o synthase [Ornithinibacillus bavariensis]|uniref:Protoheme IX farnesyltransferase n=1 Tax=Ornithinibacillus bavariensis TaxID=545502 RepID=A0A920C6P7_9BACI|nr:heme o synthase [Ornithinibacillus bavariensis]GIO25902.1 protoheme IX farnesyltransferase [Ornithinibacillus bavariensis]HAM79698.1 protoheme IX farnesyltransferase [Ornithinibacillus sp.]